MIKCQMCGTGTLEEDILPNGDILVYCCDFCDYRYSEKLVMNEVSKKWDKLKEDHPMLYEKCEKFDVSFKHYDAILDMSRAMDELHAQDDSYPQITQIEWTDKNKAVSFNNLTEWASLVIEDLVHITSPK